MRLMCDSASRDLKERSHLGAHLGPEGAFANLGAARE